MKLWFHRGKLTRKTLRKIGSKKLQRYFTVKKYEKLRNTYCVMNTIINFNATHKQDAKHQSHTPTTHTHTHNTQRTHTNNQTHTHTPRTYTNHNTKPQSSLHTQERTYTNDTKTQPPNSSIDTHTHKPRAYTKHTQAQPPNSSIHTHANFNTALRYCTHQKARHCHTIQLVMKLIDKNEK